MLFHDNAALCGEVTERVVQHFVRCIETHGRHMQYLKFLQTVVKSENTYIRKCQDMVMSEVQHDTNTTIYLGQLAVFCRSLHLQRIFPY